MLTWYALIFIRSNTCLKTFGSDEMENSTKLLLASIINRFTWEVVYFMHNNKIKIKKPDLKIMIKSSDQDGGIGRYSSLPCTIKRRITTNVKTRNNHNCQKIKLYRSLTTKELKKEHSSRLVGRAEMGNQSEQGAQKGRGWWSEPAQAVAGRLEYPTFTYG